VATKNLPAPTRPRPRRSELHRCRFLSSFAPRVRGRSGLGRPRGLRPETPPAATQQGRPAVGPLAVHTRPRQRHPTAVRPLGPRGLRSQGRSHPQGGLNAHPAAWRRRTLVIQRGAASWLPLCGPFRSSAAGSDAGVQRRRVRCNKVVMHPRSHRRLALFQ
jgi:hypothetical protein